MLLAWRESRQEHQDHSRGAYWTIVFWIAITSICAAFSNYLIWGVYEGMHDGWCLASAMATQFFDWASVMWIACVTHYMWHHICLPNRATLESSAHLMKAYHFSVWTSSLVLMLLPFAGAFDCPSELSAFGSVYGLGTMGDWCWISGASKVWWSVVIFYGPLWIVEICVVVAVVLCRNRLKTVFSNPDERDTPAWRDTAASRDTYISADNGSVVSRATDSVGRATGEGMPRTCVSTPTASYALAEEEHRGATKVQREAKDMYNWLKGYPIVLVITWLVGNVRRLWQFADATIAEDVPFAAVQLMFNSLSGFFNYIFFIHSHPKAKAKRLRRYGAFAQPLLHQYRITAANRPTRPAVLTASRLRETSRPMPAPQGTPSVPDRHARAQPHSHLSRSGDGRAIHLGPD